jgi:hypothetical protein
LFACSTTAQWSATRSSVTLCTQVPSICAAHTNDTGRIRTACRGTRGVVVRDSVRVCYFVELHLRVITVAVATCTACVCMSTADVIAHPFTRSSDALLSALQFVVIPRPSSSFQVMRSAFVFAVGLLVFMLPASRAASTLMSRDFNASRFQSFPMKAVGQCRKRIPSLMIFMTSCASFVSADTCSRLLQ